ncbi:MAG: terpene cyclase/mutase family protein [Planctomycetota bacterium]|nr:terpene cyclase/mutase family protein [Planctomycetota bacterium]MDA1165655.1 terpene cyclase/mutase family protein [Planctomycetota bacterium]
MNRCLQYLLLASALGGSTSTTCRAQNTPADRQVDQSIVRALKYLSARQRPSGAWQLESPSRGRGLDAASTTSLAIMAYMSAGHVPAEGPYGEQMDRGIRWVLNNQNPDGLFQHRAGSGPMYTHGICTLMLAEVAGMADATLSDRIRTSLERAIMLILRAQAVPKGRNHAGGWRYHPSSNDSDLSVTGWQLLALRAAKNIGCDVPAEAIEFAVAYVNRCSDRRGGGFSYHPDHGSSPTRTGTGILCLEICGEHHTPATMAAADYLLRRPLQYDDTFFFYGAYYCTVGMFQVGGRHWDETRSHMSSVLLARQHPDGSWNPSEGSEVSFGPIYATSMAVLALAVEYRYLPIYQR